MVDDHVLPHPLGTDPEQEHKGEPWLKGIKLGASVQGRRVQRCDGMLGRIEGPHTPASATIRWDDGSRYSIHAACLRDAPTRCDQNAERNETPAEVG